MDCCLSRIIMTKILRQQRNFAQSQVLELLGRSLYVCNVIELRLRWMHKHSGGIWTGKTPEELLKSINNAVEKQQKDDKRMLKILTRQKWSIFLLASLILKYRARGTFVEQKRNSKSSWMPVTI